MLEAIELDVDDLQQMHRLRRVSPDPYVGQMKSLKLIRQLRGELRRLTTEERSNNQARADQLLELLNRPPDAALREAIDPLADRIKELESSYKTARWVLGTILTLALGSLMTGIGVLWTRAEHEGETNVRIERLQSDVQLLLRGEWRRVQTKDNP
jgi:hypothetical protein